MEPSSSEKNLYQKDSSSSNGNSKLFLVFLVAAVCFAFAAFIIAIVSLVQQNGSSSSSVVNVGSGLTSNEDYDDDKVWLLHIGDGDSNSEYVDEETGRVQGFNPDLMNAVCRVANKNCALVVDITTNCWDSTAGEAPRGGFGLMSGWYDACGAWRVKQDRQRTFKFSNEFTSPPLQGFITLAGNPDGFNWQDIRGKNIGFIDGFSADEHCLAKAEGITGNPVEKGNIYHCVDYNDCYDKLVDGTIDAAFLSANKIQGKSEVQIAGEEFSACPVGGFAMMTRYDSRLIEWFNPALTKLLASKEYHEICQDVLIAHGHKPGYQPEDFCIGL